MELTVDGTTLSIGQMGPDFLLLDELIDHPPCEATIMLSIDGHERRWEVRLPEGLAKGRKRVMIAEV